MISRQKIIKNSIGTGFLTLTIFIAPFRVYLYSLIILVMVIILDDYELEGVAKKFYDPVTELRLPLTPTIDGAYIVKYEPESTGRLRFIENEISVSFSTYVVVMIDNVQESNYLAL